MKTSSVIEMSGVTKTFGNNTALAGVDLSVEQGEVVALLDPNGAGKTTAISIMLGLRAPTGGEVRLFGLPPRDLRARSRVGAMLQESGVPDTLRVREVIDLFRSYYPNPLPTDEVIERAGLEEKERAVVGQLSGGQRQRVYFALAICGDPEVLFLDEPTVALDVDSRRRFWEQIRGSAEAGRTVLLTTHYLEEADALADRIVVVDRGTVVVDGTSESIKAYVDRKRVRFETQNELGPGFFEDLPVSGLSIEDGAVAFVSPAPEEILTRLIKSNVKFSNLEVVGADLEEAFLELTKKESPVVGR